PRRSRRHARAGRRASLPRGARAAHLRRHVRDPEVDHRPYAAEGDRMTTEYKALVCQMLESQAYREMMAANLLGHSLKHVPDLENKKSVAHDLVEELEHYESTVELYRELTGRDIGEVIGPKLARVPYPESWMELAMAQFLYDRAGEFHLREYRSC